MSGTSFLTIYTFHIQWSLEAANVSFSASKCSVPHLHEQIARRSSLCRIWNSRVATMSRAVRQVGIRRSSDLKSRYLIRSNVKSGISDFRVSSKKSAPGLILLHLSRACSMSSTSPAVHCTHRGEEALGIFILWSLSWVGSIQCSIFHKKERISGVRPGTQTASQDLPQSIIIMTFIRTQRILVQIFFTVC